MIDGIMRAMPQPIEPAFAAFVDYLEATERFPPRHRLPPLQDFETMTAKHGRPIGPFERDRQFPYNVNHASTSKT